MFTTLTKKRFLIALGITVLAIFTIVGIATKQKKSEDISSLSQEDLAKLTKPSVVRIIQHVSGEIVAPDFELDIKKLALTLKPNQTKKLPVNEYLSGSGFVINPSGYILTNSHVISQESVKRLQMEDLLKQAANTKGLDTEQLDPQDLRGWQQFAEDAIQTLINKSQFNLKTQVTVLNPSDSQESQIGLLKNGFPAEIVSVNNNFYEDEKDIGLIKIVSENLPALKLKDGNSSSVGNKIYAFGFPATGEFNNRSPLEATLTVGIISSLKYSQNKDFKIFQTDAKISRGSSGSPLFDENGEVVGIVTFQTYSQSEELGDNFAFAVPILLAKTVLDKNGVANEPGDYGKLFVESLGLLKAGQCQQAVTKLKTAAETNEDFVGEKNLSSYLQYCNQLISSGQSIDTPLARFSSQIKSINGFTWFVVAGRIILVILLAWIVWKLSNRLKKDEGELTELAAELTDIKNEKELLLNKLSQKGVQLPFPEELHSANRQELHIPHPHIVEYVKEARAIGLHDEDIRSELEKAEWGEEEISHALQV